jgi:hypothetical protein
MALPIAARKIPMVALGREAALEVFAAWSKLAGRVEY